MTARIRKDGLIARCAPDANEHGLRTQHRQHGDDDAPRATLCSLVRPLQGPCIVANKDDGQRHTLRDARSTRRSCAVLTGSAAVHHTIPTQQNDQPAPMRAQKFAGRLMFVSCPFLTQTCIDSRARSDRENVRQPRRSSRRRRWPPRRKTRRLGSIPSTTPSHRSNSWKIAATSMILRPS